MLSTATETLAAGDELDLHHHARPDVSRRITAGRVDELLVPIVAGGAVVVDGGAAALGDLAAAGERRTADIEALDTGVRRLVNPHTYHVSITDDLFDLKQSMLSRF